MLIREAKCDACDKRVDVSEVTGWLRVITYAAGPEEAMELHEKAERNESVNEGDFCSLSCLSSWSGGLHNLQEMDRPSSPTTVERDPRDPLGPYL